MSDTTPETTVQPTPIVIIGAGAAGLMAAIMAARAGAKVRLLDSQRIIGAKILVSGGGRCNVTNEFVAPSRFNGGSAQFIGRILRSYSVEDTHRFFKSLDVELKLEPTGKFFPVSDKARTVLSALTGAAEAAGVELTTQCPVLDLERDGENWIIVTPAERIPAGAVILCTGGLALPKSGSDGRGYHFARKWGHTLVPTTPALTPLLAADAPHAGLSGVTLPARLRLMSGTSPHQGAVLTQHEGSFLFTHVGYSGPVALNISRHVARERWTKPEASVFASFLPQVAPGEEAAWWQGFQKANARKTLVNALRELLPARLAERIAIEARVPFELYVGRMEKAQIAAARAGLFDHALPVTEVADYVKAEATAGGIELAEIEPASMMSKLAEGLFFAGEICDVDGWLGGYNFQWAWSSGAVAGRGAARYVKKRTG